MIELRRVGRQGAACVETKEDRKKKLPVVFFVFQAHAICFIVYRSKAQIKRNFIYILHRLHARRASSSNLR